MQTTLVLKELMSEQRISGALLAEKSNLSKQTIYKLTSKKNPPKAIEFETISKIVPALKEITGKDVGIQDILVLN